MPHPPSAAEAFVEKEAGYRSGKPLRHPKTGTELSFPQSVRACGELSAIEKAPHWR
jgi:hypothetical protein